MSNAVKQATTTVLLKIAAADGEINIDELELIEVFADDQPADQLFANAHSMELPDLLSDIEKPEDRFVIRLKAQLMALSDGTIFTDEQKLIDTLVKELPLPDDLEKFILEVLDNEAKGTSIIDSEELAMIYQKSSFA